MARRKGKSQRRVRDWQLRQVAEEQGRPAAGARQAKLTQRAVKLPPWRLETPEESLENLPKAEGMVVGLFPGGTIVRVEGRHILAGVAGTFRAPEGSSALAVGDYVTVALAEHADRAAGADKYRADGMILARQLRQTAVSRPQPRSGKRRDQYRTEPFEKVIAANMDVMLIVASSTQPPLRQALVDRFLIVAERGGLEPLLVVNKLDLAAPDPQALDNFAALGLKVLVTSALTGEGLDALRKELAGRKSVLAGASGVGKSALINALVPGAQAATREIRMRDQRGRHTTTSTDVYDLPGGGIIVDTPGVRELGVQLQARELPWYFPEFQALIGQCRFNDCTHTHEPGCAVIQAVSEGTIPARRYESYLRILESLEENRI